MSEEPKSLRFLADHNVPESVCVFLEACGYDVVRVRDIMPADAPDPIVAEAALRDARVLISWDKDFNHQRFAKPRFHSLSRIGMSCSNPEGLARIKANIDRIEFEWERANGEPMLLRIGKDKYLARG